MKLAVIAAALLVLTVPAQARMRHDRVCDIAQERVDPTTYNPDGGNAVMFDGCVSIEGVLPGDSASRAAHWKALSCGYQAYREGKRQSASPYQNRELMDAWKMGWKVARKSCTMGRLPTF